MHLQIIQMWCELGYAFNLSYGSDLYKLRTFFPISYACACSCVCRQIIVVDSVDIRAMMIKCMHFLLPNLVKATGVETLLRFPSSARFDEFPVQGKSFPFRKTINCSLQVELSTDCNAEGLGVPASGKWIEATATEFCGWNKKGQHLN